MQLQSILSWLWGHGWGGFMLALQIKRGKGLIKNELKLRNVNQNQVHNHQSQNNRPLRWADQKHKNLLIIFLCWQKLQRQGWEKNPKLQLHKSAVVGMMGKQQKQTNKQQKKHHRQAGKKFLFVIGVFKTKKEQKTMGRQFLEAKL